MHTEGSSRGQNAQKMDLGLNEHAEIEIKASLLEKLQIPTFIIQKKNWTNIRLTTHTPPTRGSSCCWLRGNLLVVGNKDFPLVGRNVVKF